MPSPESLTPEISHSDESGGLDGIVPVEKRPEIRRRIVDGDVEDFLREQEEFGENRKNPKKPTIH